MLVRTFSDASWVSSTALRLHTWGQGTHAPQSLAMTSVSGSALKHLLTESPEKRLKIFMKIYQNTVLLVILTCRQTHFWGRNVFPFRLTNLFLSRIGYTKRQTRLVMCLILVQIFTCQCKSPPRKC